MSEKEDSVLDAPHKPSQRVTRKASKEAKESYSACGIAISTHLGKAGQGTCFGTEVTKVFSDLLTLVGSVKAELEEERHEARDREARLTRKVSELCKMLAAAETRESDALTKLTTVEKTVQTLTKQVQQLQQEAKKGREGESRSSRTEHEGTIGAQCSVASPNEAAKSWHEQTDEIVESRTEHGREPSPSSSRPQQGLARPRTDGTGEYKSQERRPRISASTAARPEHKKRPRALDPNAEDAAKTPPRFMPPTAENDLWTLVSSRKDQTARKVLYIGNVRPGTTGEDISKYITERAKGVGVHCPQIFNTKVFEAKPGAEFSGIRVSVDAESAAPLTEWSFWPRPLYARQWNFSARGPNKPEGSSRGLNKPEGSDHATPGPHTPLPDTNPQLRGNDAENGEDLHASTPGECASNQENQ